MEETATQTIDVGKVILETINELSNKLFTSIDNTIFPELDKLIFIDSDITSTTNLSRIVGSDYSSGLLVIAYSLLVAFVLYYLIRRMTAFYSGQEVEPVYVFFVKAIVIGIITSFSLDICCTLISLTHDFTEAICGLGSRIYGSDVSFSALINFIRGNSSTSNYNLFSFDGIISSMVSISSFSLIITFTFRYILVKLLILLSPFSFLCLINKSTSGIFKCWLKSFFSLLFIQTVIALLLLLATAIINENSTGISTQLLIIGALYAILKSNQFVKEFINGTGISSDFSAGMSGIKSLFSGK